MRALFFATSLFAALALSGCLLPNGGTPVFVDSRAGSWWSGKGLLTEVSPDQKRCKVAVRDRALFVHHLWVDCKMVHQRVGRD
jgi:hypothetical protein